jgi:hypothetical protein
VIKHFIRTVAVAGAAALALSACSGNGGGGGSSDPESTIAAGLDARIENGATFTLRLEGDLQALAAASGEELPPEAESLLTEGGLRGAFHQDIGFAMTFGAGDGMVEMRFVDSAMYLRLDPDALADMFPEMGDPAELGALLDSGLVAGDLADLGRAALAGNWVGITGLSEERLTQLAEDLGGTTTTEQPDTEDLERLFEEHGFTDGEELTDRYLVVSGDGPTYDVALRARAFVEALIDISREMGELPGGASANAEDLPDPADVPEQIEGIQVTVQNGVVTTIRADMVALATAMGEDTEDLEEGDLTLVLELGDLGNQLEVPSGAVTTDFEELVGGAMGAFMGGMDFGGDSGGFPTDFPTDFEFPSDFPTDFEFPSDFPTELMSPQ